jgi:hypothetical protein
MLVLLVLYFKVGRAPAAAAVEGAGCRRYSLSCNVSRAWR